jgi:phytoene dehydrogenase-like protein
MLLKSIAKHSPFKRAFSSKNH